MEDKQEEMTWTARGKMGVDEVVKWPLGITKGHVRLTEEIWHRSGNLSPPDLQEYAIPSPRIHVSSGV